MAEPRQPPAFVDFTSGRHVTPHIFLSFVNSAHFGNVEFNEQDDGCVWNIKVDWANYNESVLWKNVNLCRFNVLRLRYDPGSKTTSFIAE
jgi:hypothetical protein